VPNLEDYNHKLDMEITIHKQTAAPSILPTGPIREWFQVNSIDEFKEDTINIDDEDSRELGSGSGDADSKREPPSLVTRPKPMMSSSQTTSAISHSGTVKYTGKTIIYYSVVLCCTVLCRAVSYRTVLYYITLYYFILYHTRCDCDRPHRIIIYIPVAGLEDDLSQGRDMKGFHIGGQVTPSPPIANGEY